MSPESLISNPPSPICNQIREDLGTYLDRELPVERRRFVDEHLADCAPCRSELDRLAEIHLAFRQIQRAAPPEILRDRLMEEVMAAAPPIEILRDEIRVVEHSPATQPPAQVWQTRTGAGRNCTRHWIVQCSTACIEYHMTEEIHP